MGSTGVRKRQVLGFDYVHAAVDDHSRLAYAEIHPDEKGATAAGFLTRAAEFFAGHGIEIREVITDNAWAYRHSVDFCDTVAALGAEQRFIKPHCPWQNGKVERFNRTLQTEWAYRQPFTTNDARAEALAPWLKPYNETGPATPPPGQFPPEGAPSPVRAPAATEQRSVPLRGVVTTQSRPSAARLRRGARPASSARAGRTTRAG